MITALDVPFFLLGLFLLITSWIDIKTHEVPDYLTYTLVAAGICFAAVSSLVARDLTVVWSVLGALIGFGIGALLYYTGQWGGGDAKLLMGVGAILGFNATWFARIAEGAVIPMPAFVWFLAFTLVGGAAYGIVWMLVILARNPRVFWKAYIERLRSLQWPRAVVLGASAVLIALSAYVAYRFSVVLAVPVFVLAALVYCAFYFTVAVQVVEVALMRKRVKPKALTEGDWVIGGLRVGRSQIIPTGTVSVSLKQIALARKKAPRTTVTIKTGIPFVPSFLIAYVALLVLRSL